ncbi:hypothetical protein BGX21_006294 [Mortierella sp. AD011]|nr:hypothetical protein BGX20_008638 [Mortierella sp. AD010]KAF9399406.1 hypothetical protein BGX21_006294 [Mortierella sp. AD011]
MDSTTAEATCRKLVAILALDAGFEGITAPALDSLTHAFESFTDHVGRTRLQVRVIKILSERGISDPLLTSDYILPATPDTQQMYSIAHSFSELAGRTKPNIHDLQQAFIDMKVNPASLESYVRSASRSKTPLLRGPLQETLAKVQKKEEKNVKLLDSDIEDNSESDDDEPATTSTPGTKVTARTIVFVKRPNDPQRIRELNAEQSRLVESNLKRLMAAENKIAMAAAHKDGSTAAVATDLLIVKEEQESAESIDRRALTKLEALPVVNYEFSKRQQQMSASNREGGRRQHQIQLHELQGEPLNSALTGGSGAGSGGGVSTYKSEWRKERRRMRREQRNAMEELEQNINHKRLRQESVHSNQLKLVSMDIDP